MDANASTQSTNLNGASNGAAASEGDKGGELPSWDQVRDEAVAESKKTDDTSEKAAKSKDDKPATEQQKPTKVKRSEWEVYQHKLGELNRKSAAFEAKYDAGQRELAALESRGKELEARAATLDKLETDPKAFVEHFAKKVGMTPTKVVNALNEYFLENKSPADLEIAKLRQEQAERDERMKQERETETKRQAEARIQGYKERIAEVVQSREGDYPNLSVYPSWAVANSVWNRIEDHFKRTGENLQLDKVLSMMESEEDELFLKKEERRKRKLGSAQQAQTPERGGTVEPANLDGQQRPSTLTNRLAGQRTPQARQLSDADAWEEAKREAGAR